MRPNLLETADLVTFTVQKFNGNFFCMCSDFTVANLLHTNFPRYCNDFWYSAANAKKSTGKHWKNDDIATECVNRCMNTS